MDYSIKRFHDAHGFQYISAAGCSNHNQFTTLTEKEVKKGVICNCCCSYLKRSKFGQFLSKCHKLLIAASFSSSFSRQVFISWLSITADGEVYHHHRCYPRYHEIIRKLYENYRRVHRCYLRRHRHFRRDRRQPNEK